MTTETKTPTVWKATLTTNCLCRYCDKCEMAIVAEYGDKCHECDGELIRDLDYCDGMCREDMENDVKSLFDYWHDFIGNKPFIILGRRMTWRNVSGSTETMTTYKEMIDALTGDYELTLRFEYDTDTGEFTAFRSSHDEYGAAFDIVTPSLDWIREHRSGCSDTISLYEWSQNFDYPSPFSLFLDIIGWSDEEYGMRLCSDKRPSMGYMECDLLGDALKEYAQYPEQVEEVINLLLINE